MKYFDCECCDMRKAFDSIWISQLSRFVLLCSECYEDLGEKYKLAKDWFRGEVK